MGIRPHEFWQQTPRETHRTITALLEIEKERRKEWWKIARWVTANLINISGKYVERTVKETDLLWFPEETVTEEVDHERRMAQAMENLRYLKSKFWTAIPGSSLDDIKIFGEEDYKRVMSKYKKEN